MELTGMENWAARYHSKSRLNLAMLFEDTSLSGSPRKKGRKKKDAEPSLFPEPAAEYRASLQKYSPDWVGATKLPKLRTAALSIREVTVDGGSTKWLFLQLDL
ncbi:unnamed protein product [Calypogeia fissa]